MCRKEVRKDKDKAELELNLSRDMTCDKMFHKYINNKRKRSDYENPLLNWTEQLVTNYMDKAEVHNIFFVLLFTMQTRLQESQVPGTRGNVCSKGDLLPVEKD